jgi:hypothetical protein
LLIELVAGVVSRYAIRLGLYTAFQVDGLGYGAGDVRIHPSGHTRQQSRSQAGGLGHLGNAQRHLADVSL